MASRLFYDPHKLLVVAPLVTSAWTFWFAVDQHIFLGIFRNPAERDKSAALLPSYFSQLFPTALTVLFSLNAVSVGAAAANLYTRRAALRVSGADRWYISGLVFALAHFAFVPAVMWKVKDMVEDRPKGGTTDVLKKWLRVHRVRTLTVDLLAFGSFVVATLASVTL